MRPLGTHPDVPDHRDHRFRVPARVYEVLTLRGEIGRHRRIQQDVLARFDRERLNLVKECRACGTCYDSSAEKCEKDGQELGVEVPVERVIDGKFRLDRVIGRGGMGAVYEATDRLNRRVAVKVMTGHLIGSGTALRRFAREAQASARLGRCAGSSSPQSATAKTFRIRPLLRAPVDGGQRLPHAIPLSPLGRADSKRRRLPPREGVRRSPPFSLNLFADLG